MAALTLVPPEIFKQVLEYLKWAVVDDGKYNWTLVKDGTPITIPKRGRMVGRALFEQCLIDGILNPGDYWEALETIGYKFGDSTSA
jgi:hypothetical protein